MSNTFVFGKRLGKGGYGKVYECKSSSTGDQMAVKKIDNREEGGINCLMEIALMMSLRHPYLNYARTVHIQNDCVYIFMDMAIGDLSLKPPVTPENLRKWTFQLLCAVDCLHKENYIHCDIKAANVLQYSNGDVRLSDFTLIMKKWTNTIKYSHKISTCTHRPPEVFLKRGWDEKVDIWSLGVTLYEIAYGELPFPYQGEGINENDLIADKSLNCILDWAERYSKQVTNVSKRSVDYSPHIPSLISNHEFNNLLNRMLQFDPMNRATADELLKSPYLTGMVIPGYRYLEETGVKIPHYDLNLYDNVANMTLDQLKVNGREYIFSLGKKLFNKTGELRVFSRDLRILTSIFIAVKMVARVSPDMGPLQREILEIERVLCQKLYFQLL